MKKKVFILLEVVTPLVFFSSWMIWSLLVKSYSFKEAFETSAGITFMIIIMLNILISLNYKKTLD